MYAIVSGNNIITQVQKLARLEKFKEVYHDIGDIEVQDEFDCPVYYEPDLFSALLACVNINECLFIVSKNNNMKCNSMRLLAEATTN